MEEKKNSGLLTVRQAAEQFKIPRKTVLRWVHSGEVSLAGRTSRQGFLLHEHEVREQSQKTWRWTREQEELLIALYPNHTALETAARLGRTPDGVRSKIGSMGITKEPGPASGHTRTGRGPRHWTTQDEQTLRRCRQENRTMREIAVLMGRGIKTIRTMSRRLGLTKKPETAHRNWTQQETEFVRENYGRGYRDEELADRLGRSKAAVRKKAAQMGIQICPDRRKWTQEELHTLRELSASLTHPQIAVKMGRTTDSVKAKAKVMGLSKEMRDGWYTAQDIAEICGVNADWVITRIRAGTIRTTDSDGNPASETVGGTWRVDEKDLRNFLRQYPHELIGRNVDLVNIIDIVAGLDYPNPRGTSR